MYAIAAEYNIKNMNRYNTNFLSSPEHGLKITLLNKKQIDNNPGFGASNEKKFNEVVNKIDPNWYKYTDPSNPGEMRFIGASIAIKYIMSIIDSSA
jgi:hypothetical protein